MKKLLAKIVCAMLVLVLGIATLSGCSEGSWSGKVTLKNSGEVWSNGGFIAETENYIYFINGLGVSTSNNKMGEPLKGALMVADKNDLSNSEIVVPKLMVASDYNMGVFIDGGYAYYGTPSVEKNSYGTVSKSKMMFMRTKLDGSGKTDEFFTINALSTEYRIVKADNTVYIYYFENNALYCYNTAKDTKSTVIKMDKTANGYTLDALTFVSSSDYNGVVAYFTATVYTDKYDKDNADKAGYERTVATYNEVYAVIAGNNTPKRVATGQINQEKYNEKFQISLIHNGYLFYSKTINGTTKYYAISLADASELANWSEGTKNTEIINKDYIKSTNLFNGSLDKVYVVGETNVYETTALTKDAMTKKPILTKDDVLKLLFVRTEGGVEYLYYYNESSEIAKINLETLEKEIRVSDASVETSWYMPEIITVGQGDDAKDYIFYCDSSLLGKSYIEYIDLASEVEEKDTDEDGKTDLYFLKEENAKKIGKMADSDRADIVSEKIDKLYLPEGGLGDDAEKDAEFMEEYNKVLDEYNALGSIKGKVKNIQEDKLAYIKKALEVIEKYKELEGIMVCVDTEEAEALGFDVKYQAVKDYFKKFKNSSNREVVDDLIADNLKAYLTKAEELFND